MKHIVIIGASGYVGNALIEKLHSQYHITAIVRGSNPIVRNYPNVHYIDFESTENFIADAIINTAFSSHPDIYLNRMENIKMAEYINSHSSIETKVIHLSTLAVFGPSLELEQRDDFIPNRWDSLYIESKLHMENCLRNHLDNKKMHILRLGNVFGPGSMWLCSLASAIILGEKTKYEGAFSNTTYIGNLCAYIGWLLNNDSQRVIHHVAEISHTKWTEWIAKMEHLFMLQAIAIPSHDETPKPLVRALLSSISISPIKTLKNLKSNRYFQSRIYHLIQTDSVKMAIVSFHKKQSIHLLSAIQDQALLSSLTCQKQFLSIMEEGYTPPYQVEEIWAACMDWLNQSGYPVRMNIKHESISIKNTY